MSPNATPNNSSDMSNPDKSTVPNPELLAELWMAALALSTYPFIISEPNRTNKPAPKKANPII